MNNPVAVSLGTNLRRIRESKGVSRKQLADALGVSEVSICGYENAHKLPPLDKIFAMADFLGVSTTDLTGETKKTADKIIFEYRLQRAKKMMVYLDSLMADLPGYELDVNERGNISIFSPEKITYNDGVISSSGKGQAITFKNAEIFVDVMEQAEHRALRSQIPFNQALNELVADAKFKEKYSGSAK